MAVNIGFGTVFLPEESFMRHLNLSGACSLPAWNYSRNRFNFPVIAVLSFYWSWPTHSISLHPLLRNLLLFVMDK